MGHNMPSPKCLNYIPESLDTFLKVYVIIQTSTLKWFAYYVSHIHLPNHPFSLLLPSEEFEVTQDSYWFGYSITGSLAS